MNDETIAIVNTPRSIGVVEDDNEAMKQVNSIDIIYPLPTVTSQYWQTEQQCCEITTS
jgi:hypothetical protein